MTTKNPLTHYSVRHGGKPVELPAKIEFVDLGAPGILWHDMPCPIHYDKGEFAVIDMDKWTFNVSRRAQAEGYTIVRAKTSFQKWLLRMFFGLELV